MSALDGTAHGSDAFGAARRRGFIQDVLAELSGHSGDLLPFDQVREKLQLSSPAPDVRVKEVRLDQIVGSVGRYRDFNRAFLPRGHIDPARWTRINRLLDESRLPPVDLFKVGDAYFVRDGNHRVSVARARRRTTIRARVVDIPVRVPFGPETSPDDLILKAGYAEFLVKTSLDRSCPNQRIELTRPGAYRELLRHIEVHQFYVGLRSAHYPSLPEASVDWYRNVYLPVVERIRASHILDRFPGRTEADLYLWTAENRAELQMRYGGQEKAQAAVDAFARENPPKIWGRIRRFFRRFWLGGQRLLAGATPSLGEETEEGDH